MTEAIGYLGSALVAASLVMSNVWRLRIINFAGALVFVAYGLAARIYPVLAVNAFIAAVDLYYILQLRRRTDIFRLMRASPSDPLVENFLAYHAKDIWNFFPDFSLARLNEPRCIFTLRNLLPVGLLVYTTRERAVRVHLDYVAPDWRDLKNASYLYNRPQLSADFGGFDLFEAASSGPQHDEYLRRIGFTEDPGRRGFFTKPIRD